MTNLYNNPLTKKSRIKKSLNKITQEEITKAVDKFLKQGGVITRLKPLPNNSNFTFETSSVKEQINKNLDPR